MEKRLTEKMPPFKEHEWKFITLTTRSNDFDLKVQLTDLVQSFRSLRRRVEWIRHCDYGWGVIEVTFNTKTGKWHPHLHIIAHCSFWAHNALSKAWCESSGGSSVCDIRPIGSGVARVKYVTKYLGKPPDFSECKNPQPHLIDYYRAMKHRRMLIKFGSHPDFSNDKKSKGEEEPKEKFRFVMTLEQLVERVRASRDGALKILHECFPDKNHPIYNEPGLPPPS